MTQENPTCLMCGMHLTMENLIEQAKKIPFEKRCHHGVSKFPLYDSRGFLACYVDAQEKAKALTQETQK